jgi:hypothetical protein
MNAIDTTQLERGLTQLLADDLTVAIDSGALNADTMRTMRCLRDQYEALCSGQHDARGRPI